MAPPLHPNFVFPAIKTQPQNNSSSCYSRDGQRFPTNVRQRVASSISSTPNKTLAWFQRKVSLTKKSNPWTNRRASEGDKASTDRRIAISPALTSTNQITRAEQLRSSRPRTFSPHNNRRSSLRVTERPCIEKVSDPRTARRTHFRDSCPNCGAGFVSEPSVHPPFQHAPMTDQQADRQVYVTNSPALSEVASVEPEEDSERYSQDSGQSAPSIPWETRPKPKRPFRPAGEYDAEIAMLSSPGLAQSSWQGHEPRQKLISSHAMPAARPAPFVHTTRSNSYSLPRGEANHFTTFNPRHDFAFSPTGKATTARDSSFYSVASFPAARQAHLELHCRRCSSLTECRSSTCPHRSYK